MRRSRRVLFYSFFFFFFFFIGLISYAGTSQLFKKPFTLQHLTPKDGLSSEMVYAIAVQEDKIWFGTYGGGATLYDRSKNSFKAYTTKGEPQDKTDDGNSINWKNLPPYNHVWVIVPDEDRIWFGTYFYGFGGGGISYYQPKRKNPWRRFNTNNGRAKKIVSMAVDGDRLWVGSEKGLSLLDKKTEQWKDFFSTSDGLSGNFVNALLVDSEYLWAGTNGGVSRLDKGKRTWKTYGQKEGLTDLEIRSLARVGDTLWAGSTKGSLFAYEPTADRWRKIEPSDPLKNGEIHSMAVIHNQVFVCRDNGVSVFDIPAGSWDDLTTADGLPSNTVFCAAGDKGTIWFGTDQGAAHLILAPQKNF
jgi:ligand-binding sensor domain-containing protein